MKKGDLLLILLTGSAILVGITFADIVPDKRSVNQATILEENTVDEPLDLYSSLSKRNVFMDSITISTKLDSSKKSLIDYIDKQAIAYGGGLDGDVFTLEGMVEVNATNYNDELSDNIYSFMVDENTTYQRENGDNLWNITKAEFAECFKEALSRRCLFEAQLSKGVATKVIIYY